MEDSRQSPHEIAEKCGFSRQKVWRIIDRLNEKYSVWGYTTVVDDNYDNSNTYFALVKTRVPFSNIIDKLIQRVKKEKSGELGIKVLGNYYVNGLYDWVIIFTAKNLCDAKKMCGYLQKYYGNHLKEIDLLNTVFPLRKSGKINPNIEQLKDFTIS